MTNHKNHCDQRFIEPSERVPVSECDCQQLTDDGTAGHSKVSLRVGWIKKGKLDSNFDELPEIPTIQSNFHADGKIKNGPEATICEMQLDQTAIDCSGPFSHRFSKEELVATAHLFTIAQSAPHDCGDPECPGFQNKRKLELYDKFQRAIHEFAKAGLLT